MPTAAIASEFLEAYARIPRAQQKKVREFTKKFQAYPKSPSINYEKLHAGKDERVRTVGAIAVKGIPGWCFSLRRELAQRG